MTMIDTHSTACVYTSTTPLKQKCRNSYIYICTVYIYICMHFEQKLYINFFQKKKNFITLFKHRNKNNIQA